MDNDDLPVGRILSRREVLALFGTAGLAVLSGCSDQAAQPTAGANVATGTTGAAASPTLNAEAQTVTVGGEPTAQAAVATADTANATTTVPNCVVRPALTEGPYFVDLQLDRSDIRTDPTTGTAREGTPLELTFNVSQVSEGACAPLADAIVDIWHCDAAGQYSAVQDRGFTTSEEKWLRGFQRTDAGGVAKFTSIFPGWYPGRAVHIHFKIRTGLTGADYEFTSQLFFDEATQAEALAQGVYAAKGMPDRPNSRDGIFSEELVLTTTKTDQGYAASFDIALDLSA